MWRRLTWSCKRLQGEAGQSTAEYGAIVCLVAIAGLTLLSLMYTQLSGLYGTMAELLRTVVPGQ